jgi:hypothetical protein
LNFPIFTPSENNVLSNQKKSNIKSKKGGIRYAMQKLFFIGSGLFNGVYLNFIALAGVCRHAGGSSER